MDAAKPRSISIKWDIEDIKLRRNDLTDEQASVVLETLFNKHDANIGVNWEVIDIIAEILYPKE